MDVTLLLSLSSNNKLKRKRKKYNHLKKYPVCGLWHAATSRCLQIGMKDFRVLPVKSLCNVRLEMLRPRLKEMFLLELFDFFTDELIKILTAG